MQSRFFFSKRNLQIHLYHPKNSYKPKNMSQIHNFPNKTNQSLNFSNKKSISKYETPNLRFSFNKRKTELQHNETRISSKKKKILTFTYQKRFHGNTTKRQRLNLTIEFLTKSVQHSKILIHTFYSNHPNKITNTIKNHPLNKHTIQKTIDTTFGPTLHDPHTHALHYNTRYVKKRRN